MAAAVISALTEKLALAEAAEEKHESAAEATINKKAEGEENEEDDDEVLVLLCILHQDPNILEGRHIWRRIAVPAEFSLLELHVALQNAFDWENMHLHNFQQPRKPVDVKLPAFSGFGTTNIASASTLDMDVLNPKDVRTFQSVVGIRDAGENLIAATSKGGNEEEAIVYVQQSLFATEGQLSASDFKEVLDERAFFVQDVLNSKSRALVYEYDFGISHEMTILFEGAYRPTEGVNYPTCLAGSGASRAEDGNDVDDDGNLLSSYDYDNFAVLEVIANYTDTYSDSWPMGPGEEDISDVARCYMCRYNRECGRRRECNGTCCDYCLKSSIHFAAGTLELEEADALYQTTVSAITSTT